MFINFICTLLFLFIFLYFNFYLFLQALLIQFYILLIVHSNITLRLIFICFINCKHVSCDLQAMIFFQDYTR